MINLYFECLGNNTLQAHFELFIEVVFDYLVSTFCGDVFYHYFMVLLFCLICALATSMFDVTGRNLYIVKYLDDQAMVERYDWEVSR